MMSILFLLVGLGLILSGANFLTDGGLHWPKGLTYRRW